MSAEALSWVLETQFKRKDLTASAKITLAVLADSYTPGTSLEFFIQKLEEVYHHPISKIVKDLNALQDKGVLSWRVIDKTTGMIGVEVFGGFNG